jgi:mediator of RNA polymerase II transcription subunit 6
VPPNAVSSQSLANTTFPSETMANQQDPSSISLEEITWRSPQHVQMMGGFLHSNNSKSYERSPFLLVHPQLRARENLNVVLFYFAESPFFDAISNNASLAIQASYNENFRPFIETRDAFEGRLKTMQGLEFMVAHDPLQQHQALQQQHQQLQEPSNVWVIRKQMRKKRPVGEDEVQILATYFVVGDSIYMAPSVLNVVGGRLVSFFCLAFFRGRMDRKKRRLMRSSVLMGLLRHIATLTLFLSPLVTASSRPLRP